MMMDKETNPATEEEADRWFARLMAPDCDAWQRKAFERWREVTAHADAYAERERLWQRFGAADAAAPRLRALRERVLARTQQPPEVTMNTEMDGSHAPPIWRSYSRASPTHGHRRVAQMVAVAACICLVVGMLLALRFMGGTAPQVVYATQNAIQGVTLKDGTKVQLDVGSKLTVRYGRHDRTVVMNHGRALFDVIHDADRPFTVNLGDSRVKVLGTRFQVLRDAGHVSVTLTRGSLQLDGNLNTGSRSERLVPGDQVSYRSQDPADWEKHRVDSTAVLAWSRGRLIFHATPLAEAVQQVNRYAYPKLRLGDPSLSSLRVSGNFIAGNGDLIASTWAATLPLRVERQGDEIVLLPARQSSPRR